MSSVGVCTSDPWNEILIASDFTSKEFLADGWSYSHYQSDYADSEPFTYCRATEARFDNNRMFGGIFAFGNTDTWYGLTDIEKVFSGITGYYGGRISYDLFLFWNPEEKSMENRGAKRSGWEWNEVDPENDAED